MSKFDEELFEDVPYEEGLFEDVPYGTENIQVDPAQPSPELQSLYPSMMGPTGESEAAKLGAIEGTAWLGSKDIIAGGKSLLETGSIGEEYQQNLHEMNQAIDKAEEEYPLAFNTGDISIGASALPVKTIKGLMAVGALERVGRGESRDPWEMAKNAANGS